MSKHLKFRPDGRFTVLQFTDIHHHGGDEADLRTVALMEQILEAEQPDLVMLTGDIIEADRCIDPRQAFRAAVAPIVQRRVPWALVFGNHDDEKGITRAELLALAQESPACLAVAGPKDIRGVGNYVLTIHAAHADRAAALLYGIDSGAYAPLRLGYDWIRESQIDWYTRKARAFSARHGGPLPALAFFHIPLPEYNDVWDTCTCYGYKYENVCCPKLNSGFFAAMLEAGDVMATFAGHDHLNDFCGDLYGIRLCYGRATGYNTYGKDGFARGARIIRLWEGERRFDSWLRLDDGTVVTHQPEHLPAGRVLSGA